MSIRTIREGVLPEKRSLCGTCTNCGWYGECEVGDARRSQDPRDTVSDFSIDCPTCKKYVSMQYGKKASPATVGLYGK